MKIFSFLVVFSIIVSSNAFGQASLVRNRLQAVALGKVEDVKRELPDILAEFPEDPGVQFLHGVVLEDATRALKIYEKIIKEHPDCEWADDAQWRIVQYYSLRKDTSRARTELKVYRDKYPRSEFLLNASEMVKATVGLPKLDKSATITAQESKPAPSDEKITANPIVPEVKTPAKSTTADSKITAKPIDAEPKTPAKPTKPEAKITGKAEHKADSKEAQKEVFGLQVGSYDTREAAENEAKNYKQKRMRSTVIEKTVESATVYAVVVGEYSTKESAEKAKDLVQKNCECSPFVVSK